LSMTLRTFMTCLLHRALLVKPVRTTRVTKRDATLELLLLVNRKTHI
jgi:hypothetical protein